MNFVNETKVIHENKGNIKNILYPNSVPINIKIV